MSEPRVDRCCCRGILFRNLLEAAREARVPVEQLARERGCGATCGLCMPYIQLMARTGVTELPLIGSESHARLLRQINAGPDLTSPDSP